MELILQIQYASGLVVSVETNKAVDYYTHRVGRGARRIRGSSAKQLVNSFDIACNENGAKLLFIDEAAVKYIRNRY